MDPIGSCTSCEAEIGVGAVYKTVDIPQSDQHIALVYKCPQCGEASKIVATHEQWEEKQEEYEVVKTVRARDRASDKIELDAIECVEDLEALWASLKVPPLIEEHIGKCTCYICWRRLYG